MPLVRFDGARAVLGAARRRHGRVAGDGESRNSRRIAERGVAQGAAVRAAARRYREAHEAEIAREFAELLAIPNVASDSANIRRNAAAVMEMLRRRGVTARTLDGDGGPPAVYGELRTPGATRTVVFYAHYDGQPVDPVAVDRRAVHAGACATARWRPARRSSRFRHPGERMSGESRIYARSASDDKGAIIAMLAALDALRAGGIAPSVNLKFFFEGEEEAGSAHLRAMLEKNAELLRADAWVFCDGPVHQSGRQQVVFGARGVMGLELTTYGPSRALHSGHYGNWAPNPAVLMATLIASMRDDDGRITIAGFYDDVRPISAAERAALGAMPPIDTTLRKALDAGRHRGRQRVAGRADHVAGAQRARHQGRWRARARRERDSDGGVGVDRLPARAEPEARARARARRGAPAVARLPHRPRHARFGDADGAPEDRARGMGGRLRGDARADGHSVLARAAGGGVVRRRERRRSPSRRSAAACRRRRSSRCSASRSWCCRSRTTTTTSTRRTKTCAMQNLWDGIELFAAVMARVGHEWKESAVP